MLELLIVVAIIVIVGAIALPNAFRGIRTYRLSRTANEVATIIQATRYEAIRLNTRISVRGQPQGNTFLLWIDRNGNGQPDATEPLVLLPTDIQFVGAAAAPGTASMGAAYANMRAPAGVITFNARGTVDFAGAAPFVFGMFLGFPNEPTYGFRAVTLTPVGKTKVWSAAAGGNWR